MEDKHFYLDDVCQAKDYCIALRDAYEDGKVRGYAVRGLEEMKKNNKYRWHDLRKNPEDLPDIATLALVECVSDGILTHITAFWLGDYWNFNTEDVELTAWRYIETSGCCEV